MASQITLFIYQIKIMLVKGSLGLKLLHVSNRGLISLQDRRPVTYFVKEVSPNFAKRLLQSDG